MGRGKSSALAGRKEEVSGKAERQKQRQCQSRGATREEKLQDQNASLGHAMTEFRAELFTVCYSLSAVAIKLRHS